MIIVNLTKKKLLIPLILLVFLPSCVNDNGYRIVGDKVFFEYPWNTGFGSRIIEVDADPESFETLGTNNMKWARDKDFVFIKGKKLEFIDRDSFEVLNTEFAKDKNQVFCGLENVKEAHANNFRIREFYNLSGEKVVLGIDDNAAYDCYFGRYTYMPSDSIDALQPLYGKYYRDKNYVYWWGQKITQLQVEKLKPLNGKYIADSELVYYTNKIVEGADSSTFVVTGEQTAKDKKHRYQSEKIVD